MSKILEDPPGLERAVSLAPFTSLELGGAAEFFVRVDNEDSLIEAIDWAENRDLPLTILAGGSNVVIADGGIRGLVVRLELEGIDVDDDGSAILVTAAAGEGWDDLVRRSVAAGWAGVECLSGIPGSVGATPIQNVGAYGQEVSDTIESVRVLDRDSKTIVNLAAEDCDFGYRSSRFRRRPEDFVVLSVTFRLDPKGTPTLRYPELVRSIGTESPSLAEVRDIVLKLRRSKSMVLDRGVRDLDRDLDEAQLDPNRRSAGSFFVNPVLTEAQADRVVERALDSGIACRAEDVPRFAAGPGRSKLAAGWLIERAGFFKGMLRGNVGISSRHALALVHHGGGSTQELIRLAREVQSGVEERFGVRLQPEPVFLGFDGHPLG